MVGGDASGPDGPPPNKPDRMGNCGASGTRRLPNDNEFINASGFIMPHGYWRAPKPKPRRRKLASLNTLADVQRELSRLYADYHHGRVTAPQYTRGVYGLAQLATVMKMDLKFDHEHAKKSREAIRA